MKQQIQLRVDGELVGGWNTRKRHWYFAGRFVQAKPDRASRIESRNFRRHDDRRGYTWWMLAGADQAGNFISAVNKCVEGRPLGPKAH